MNQSMGWRRNRDWGQADRTDRSSHPPWCALERSVSSEQKPEHQAPHGELFSSLANPTAQGDRSALRRNQAFTFWRSALWLCLQNRARPRLSWEADTVSSVQCAVVLVCLHESPVRGALQRQSSCDAPRENACWPCLTATGLWRRLFFSLPCSSEPRTENETVGGRLTRKAKEASQDFVLHLPRSNLGMTFVWRSISAGRWQLLICCLRLDDGFLDSGSVGCGRVFYP